MSVIAVTRTLHSSVCLSDISRRLSSEVQESLEYVADVDEMEEQVLISGQSDLKWRCLQNGLPPLH